ncbi:MAG: hypothetical protein ACON3Z_08780 [Bradymonadia bacterium]
MSAELNQSTHSTPPEILIDLVRRTPSALEAALLTTGGVTVHSVDAKRPTSAVSGLSEFALVTLQLSTLVSKGQDQTTVNWQFDSASHTVLLRRVSESYFVVLRLDSSEHVAQAQFQLRLTAADLTPFL